MTMAISKANKEKVHKIACRTYCRSSGVLKAGKVSQGYYLLIPSGGYSCSIPVWSFNAHSV